MVDGTRPDEAPEDDPLEGLYPELAAITERFAPGSQKAIADRVAELDAGDAIDEMDEEKLKEIMSEAFRDLADENADQVVRTPIAAVAVGKTVGKHSIKNVVVVCSDGACFERDDNAWHELEAVPGTMRAAQTEEKPPCSVERLGMGPSSMCVEKVDHEPPHIDATGFRWE